MRRLRSVGACTSTRMPRITYVLLICLGVRGHSSASRQLLSMMRVGVLHGGVEHVKAIAPGERLRIVERLN